MDRLALYRTTSMAAAVTHLSAADGGICAGSLETITTNSDAVGICVSPASAAAAAAVSDVYGGEASMVAGGKAYRYTAASQQLQQNTSVTADTSGHQLQMQRSAVAVNQGQSRSVAPAVKQRDTDDGSSTCSDSVQQSQVSSSKSPSVLHNDIIGPLLLEALDGFMFMVDNSGNIQFISENVTQYLKYTQDDLVGCSIYNLVHSDDHHQFKNSLSLLSADDHIGKYRVFICRMRIKTSDEGRDQIFDQMHIRAMLQPHPWDTSEGIQSTRLLLSCIARRISSMEKTTTSNVEQFTTKQDLMGIIVDCDTSGITPGSHPYSNLIGQNVQDFCHVNDKEQLLKHNREVLCNGSNTSGVYRFRLHEKRYVFVQTKSKLFKNPTNGHPEFVMSTHSIVHGCNNTAELNGSAYHSLMKAVIGQSSSTTSRFPHGAQHTGGIAAGGRCRGGGRSVQDTRPATAQFISSNHVITSQNDSTDLLDSDFGLDLLPYDLLNYDTSDDNRQAFNDIPDIFPNSPSSKNIRPPSVSNEPCTSMLIPSVPVSAPSTTVPWGASPNRGRSTPGRPWGPQANNHNVPVLPKIMDGYTNLADSGYNFETPSTNDFMTVRQVRNHRSSLEGADLTHRSWGGSLTELSTSVPCGSRLPNRRQEGSEIFRRQLSTSSTAQFGVANANLSNRENRKPTSATPSFPPSSPVLTPDSLPSPTHPLLALKSLIVPGSTNDSCNKTGLQQIRDNSRVERNRNFSVNCAKSSSSTATYIGSATASRGADKNAGLLELLMKDEDDEDDIVLSSINSSRNAASSNSVNKGIASLRMASARMRERGEICCVTLSMTQSSPTASSKSQCPTLCSPTISTTHGCVSSIAISRAKSTTVISSSTSYPSSVDVTSCSSAEPSTTDSVTSVSSSKTSTEASVDVPDQPDSSIRTKQRREANVILKQLLSQNDCFDDVCEEGNKDDVGKITLDSERSEGVTSCSKSATAKEVDILSSSTELSCSKSKELSPDITNVNSTVKKRKVDYAATGQEKESMCGLACESTSSTLQNESVILKGLLTSRVDDNDDDVENSECASMSLEDNSQFRKDWCLSKSDDALTSLRKKNISDILAKQLEHVGKLAKRDSNACSSIDNFKRKATKPLNKDDESALEGIDTNLFLDDADQILEEGTPRKRSRLSEDCPSKRNTLLAQLLAETRVSNLNNDDSALKALSIATITPHAQMMYNKISGEGAWSSEVFDVPTSVSSRRNSITTMSNNGVRGRPRNGYTRGGTNTGRVGRPRRSSVLPSLEAELISMNCDNYAFDGMEFLQAECFTDDACLTEVLRNADQLLKEPVPVKASARSHQLLDTECSKKDSLILTESDNQLIDDAMLLEQLQHAIDASDVSLMEINSVLGIDSDTTKDGSGIPPSPLGSTGQLHNYRRQVATSQAAIVQGGPAMLPPNQRQEKKSAINAMEEQLHKIKSSFFSSGDSPSLPHNGRGLRHAQSVISLADERSSVGFSTDDRYSLSQQDPRFRSIHRSGSVTGENSFDDENSSGGGSQPASLYHGGAPFNEQQLNRQRKQRQLQQLFLQRQQQQRQQQYQQQGHQNGSPLHLQMPETFVSNGHSTRSYSPISPGLSYHHARSVNNDTNSKNVQQRELYQGMFNDTSRVTNRLNMELFDNSLTHRNITASMTDLRNSRTVHDQGSMSGFDNLPAIGGMANCSRREFGHSSERAGGGIGQADMYQNRNYHSNNQPYPNDALNIMSVNGEMVPNFEKQQRQQQHLMKQQQQMKLSQDLNSNITDHQAVNQVNSHMSSNQVNLIRSVSDGDSDQSTRNMPLMRVNRNAPTNRSPAFSTLESNRGGLMSPDCSKFGSPTVEPSWPVADQTSNLSLISQQRGLQRRQQLQQQQPHFRQQYREQQQDMQQSQLHQQWQVPLSDEMLRQRQNSAEKIGLQSQIAQSPRILNQQPNLQTSCPSTSLQLTTSPVIHSHSYGKVDSSQRLQHYEPGNKNTQLTDARHLTGVLDTTVNMNPSFGSNDCNGPTTGSFQTGPAQDATFDPTRMSGERMLDAQRSRDVGMLRRSLAPNIRQSILSGGHAVSVSSHWSDTGPTGLVNHNNEQQLMGMADNRTAALQQHQGIQHRQLNRGSYSSDITISSERLGFPDARPTINESNPYRAPSFRQDNGQPTMLPPQSLRQQMALQQLEQQRQRHGQQLNNSSTWQQQQDATGMMSPRCAASSESILTQSLEFSQSSVLPTKELISQMYPHSKVAAAGAPENMFDLQNSSGITQNYTHAQQHHNAQSNQFIQSYGRTPESTKEFVRQELRNMCATRAQANLSAPTKNVSHSEGLPRDVLDSVDAMIQEESKQQMRSGLNHTQQFQQTHNLQQQHPGTSQQLSAQQFNQQQRSHPHNELQKRHEVQLMQQPSQVQPSDDLAIVNDVNSDNFIDSIVNNENDVIKSISFSDDDDFWNLLGSDDNNDLMSVISNSFDPLDGPINDIIGGEFKNNEKTTKAATTTTSSLLEHILTAEETS